MVVGLADFERLEPPNRSAQTRLVRHVFDRKLASLFVAVYDGKLVGYALYFNTYSSFLARPGLYLGDIFVLEEYRGTGIGRSLFMRCVREGQEKGCGRMEWRVLEWNKNAADFYEKLGAARLGEFTYRLDPQNISVHAPNNQRGTFR